MARKVRVGRRKGKWTMGAVGKPLRLLLAEASRADEEGLLKELGAGGYAVSFERVLTSPDMRAALDREAWDLVVFGGSSSKFTPSAALALVRRHCANLPFIALCEPRGEKEAVKLLKAGANDFLVKG